MAHGKLAIFRRRLFTAVSVLSLLLCIASLALWARSYYRADVLATAALGERQYKVFDLTSTNGVVSPGYIDVRCSDAKPVPFYAGTIAAQVRPGWNWYSAGTVRQIPAFYFERSSFHPVAQDTTVAEWRASVPHWFLALLFAILPALHIRSLVHSRRRNRAGLCPVCGYDLRATPERCPECGLATENTENTEN